MAAKKKAKAKATFPKEEGVEGAPDRFIPPDRQDQIDNEPGDRPQLVSVKDLSEGLEIVEDMGEEEEEEPRRVEAADDEPERFEGDDGEEEERPERGGRNSRASRKVRARVNRERVLKEQQRVRAENAERRARSMEERVAKLERVTTDVQGSADVKALETKLTQIKKDLAEAVEKGDTAKQMEYTIALGDTQADLKLLKRDMEAARRQSIADEAKLKETPITGAEDDAIARDGAPSADDYIDANSSWWNKPKFARQKAIAVTLDTEILDEISSGKLDIEKYSDEHFELLNERLSELFPTLPLHNADGEAFDVAENEDDVNDRDRDSRGGNGRERNGNRRPPVGGQGTRNSGRRQASDADLARAGKVRLTEADFTQMRLYGLDPNKPEHKKGFAKERMRTILTAERRGGSNQRGAR